MRDPVLKARVRQVRLARRLTQQEAAAQLGITKLTFGNVERTGVASISTIRKVEMWLASPNYSTLFIKGGKR